MHTIRTHGLQCEKTDWSLKGCFQMSNPPVSTVYGPVHSWRFGRSLGVDLLFHSSICSFNCIYCQLGSIQNITDQQKVYVETEKVIDDLAQVKWSEVDVVTISGNGEPTLALNLGEVIDHIHRHYSKPVMVLTNATMLGDEATRQRLAKADVVACKLDSWDNESLERMNRPAEGVSYEQIVTGIKEFKKSGFKGKLAIQSMFMPANVNGVEQMAEVLSEIQPDEIHLNTPMRPYPKSWVRESRGNHSGEAKVDTVKLRTISEEEAEKVEQIIQEQNPGSKVISVYKQQ